MTINSPPDSFAAIRTLLATLPVADARARTQTEHREGQLTKPAGSLGRLEDITAWLAAWQGRSPPLLDTVKVHVFAGNHGICTEGVSAFPPAVTVQMVANFEAGGAAINQLCRLNGADLQVTPLCLETPTANFLHDPAMDETDCVAAFRAGWDSVGDGCDLICPGEMGIGNTASASALYCALFGGQAEDWVGPGTGLAGDALSHKVAVIKQAIETHSVTDGLEALRTFGGREIAAMAGLILAARYRHTPVLLDGFVCTAAAACLYAINPAGLDHCRVAHASCEPAHRRAVEMLGMAPLLDLKMRLGEGSGAALAIGVVRAAVACHVGMATFADAGVSTAEE